jgi:anthranilate phosphoribosyltransferase
VWIASGGEVRTETVDAQAFGIAPATREDLRGGSAEVNAGVFRALVAGEPGPVRSAVLLNAAAAVVAFDGPPARLADAFPSALERVAEAIDSGVAERLLQRWAEFSTSLRT